MLAPGTRVGPYEIVSLLGEGGMGEVYRARDTRLGRAVALKILPPDVAADAGRRQRFEQEARSASALNHPNIVSLYDTGAENGFAYIVTELIEGDSLREMIRRGALTQSRLLDLAAQIADGLAAAHESGIVHRDLKPENIMVTREGRPKILDFGLAKQVKAAVPGDETAFLTRTSAGAVLGTAGYMSPEQVRGDTVDARSDIFSFGLVLHEALTGRPTFERKTAAEVMTAILREDAPELPETAAPALRQIVVHCLEKEPERRFHSARDLAFALRTVSTGSRASGASTPIAAPRPRKWLWPAAAAAMAVLLALVSAHHLVELEPIDLAKYRFTPFANDHEPEYQAAWAPNGRTIAYIKEIEGVPQLLARALRSAVPIQLTKDPDRVSQPFWAPDSSLIYYLAAAGKGELRAISPAGGPSSRILADLSAAAISPDGKSLAIWRAAASGREVRASLWISSPPGAEPRPYAPAPFATPLDAGGNGLWFSPDGASILLVAHGLEPRIWLLPFPGGHEPPRRLFAGMDFAFNPKAAWMPDSRYAVLAFSLRGAEQSALWLADTKREKLRKLTAGTSSEDSPSLAPDGKRLVFTEITDDYDLIQIPLDGSPHWTLLAASMNMYSPSWSPDGSQIVYSTDRSGVREIWIHNVKAGIDRPAVTQRDFPPGEIITGLGHPVFSPDGNRFAFVRHSANGPGNIFFAPTVGGAPIRLTGEGMMSPSWSPDGSSLAGLMQKDHPWQPAVVGVGADMSPHLVPGGPTCETPLEWSPTGEWIACEARDGIALFAPDGSRSRTLPKLNSAAIAFSRDGNTLYAAGRDRGRNFVKAVDVPSGAVRAIADYASDMAISGGNNYQTRLSVSPDGKSLTTAGVTSKSGLWLLEGYPLPQPWWQFWK